MSTDTPKLTAAQAAKILSDTKQPGISVLEIPEQKALRAIATGAHVVVPAADARDVARYRWLRKQDWYDSRLCCVTLPNRSVRPGSDCPSLDRLDSAIDAALATAEGERKP